MYLILFSILIDLKGYLVRTLTHLKYRIDGIESVVQTIHMNVEKLINDPIYNNIRSSTSVNSIDDTFDMDVFPIKDNDELIKFETLIAENKEYRSLLVIYLYLLMNRYKYLYV